MRLASPLRYHQLHPVRIDTCRYAWCGGTGSPNAGEDNRVEKEQVSFLLVHAVFLGNL